MALAPFCNMSTAKISESAIPEIKGPKKIKFITLFSKRFIQMGKTNINTLISFKKQK